MKHHMSRGALVTFAFIAFVVIVGGIMLVLSLVEGGKKGHDTSTDTTGMPAITRH